ncbi:hypothetical protein AB3N62_11270 [Leptospira sp. WS4.C2]
MKIINTLLEQLDLSGSEMFDRVIKKDEYESEVMYIFRRYSAGNHHLENISNKIKAELSEMKEIAEMNFISDTDTHLISIKSYSEKRKILKNESFYSHELIAFLSAIRSGIDFIAKLSINHIRGLEGDSISVIIRQISKGVNNPILEIYSDKKEWILELREYRDRLIHKFNLLIQSGYEIHKYQEKEQRVFYPVLIPKFLPKKMLDTRKYRANLDTLLNVRSFSEESRIHKDGKNVLDSFKVNYLPDKDYINIEDFMQYHLSMYQKLAESLFNWIIKNKFKLL